MDAVTSTPQPRNEPVRDYAPGSPERASLEAALAELGGVHHELPVTIDGARHLAGGTPFDVVAPHDHAHVLGTGGERHPRGREGRGRGGPARGTGLARPAVRRARRGALARGRPAQRPVA